MRGTSLTWSPPRRCGPRTPATHPGSVRRSLRLARGRGIWSRCSWTLLLWFGALVAHPASAVAEDAVTVPARPDADTVSDEAPHAPTQAAPAARPDGDIERDRVRRALRAHGLEAVAVPQDGTPLCTIHVVREDIFVADEALPTWPNALHRKTREQVVRRALTLREGGTWTELEVRASERELRSRGLFSAVAIVPVRSNTPDCVDALVLTRDQWSLLLGWNLTSAGSTITELYVSASESNFLGRNVGLRMELLRTPGDLAVGPAVILPAVGARRLRLSHSFRVFVGQDGALEGTRNSFRLSRPLRAARDRFGWSTALDHVHRVERNFTGDTLRRWQPEDPALAPIPEQWRLQFLSASAGLDLAQGERYRRTLSPGLFLRVAHRQPLTQDVEGLPESVVAAFRDARIPRDEIAVGPRVQWRVDENRFLNLQNVNDFGVTEETRLGLGLALGGEWSEPTFGASTRAVRPNTSVAWTAPLGSDAYVRASTGAALTVMPRGTTTTLQGRARVVSPQRLAGRVHGLFTARFVVDDDPIGLALIGANTGLRGVPEGSYLHQDAMQLRVEWRSRPIRLLEARFGAVVFSDSALLRGGELAPGWQAYGSVGSGMRMRVPQFMGAVFAADLGFPLRDSRTVPFGDTGIRVPAPLLSLSMGQAF